MMREWLKKLRNGKNLTMKDMAKRLGISESYYCAIENGERQQKMNMVLASALSAIFEIPISEIVEKDQSR